MPISERKYKDEDQPEVETDIKGDAPIAGPEDAERGKKEEKDEGNDGWRRWKDGLVIRDWVSGDFYRYPENYREQHECIREEEQGIRVGEVDSLMRKVRDEAVVPEAQAERKYPNRSRIDSSNDPFCGYRVNSECAQRNGCDQ